MNDRRKPVMRPVIEPQLLKALEHFSRMRCDLSPQATVAKQEIFVTKGRDGWQTGWTVEEVCAAALKLLESEELNYLKLLHLQQRMKAEGLADWYERMMGEKLV